MYKAIAATGRINGITKEDAGCAWRTSGTDHGYGYRREDQQGDPDPDDMVGEGIVVLSDVNVIKYTHRI